MLSIVLGITGKKRSKWAATR
ncbi:hypothetical protein AZE42_12648 [Rhizopogon vesiculosus]|uniref:Uncharacterized protein n=1 Tax=Rhizopogon vesiculosus TaxID=180088 RepID=A0A1J8QLC7_9AGAM|nr:hypothetical protein AZE42_12648 [Rhizopogon vesiculosus]